MSTPAPRAQGSVAASTWGDPAAAALASGLARLAPDGSVVFTAPAGYDGPDSASSSVPVIQREAEAAGPPAGGADAPAPAAGGAPAAPAPAGGGGGSGGGQTNEQLEELAKRLYDKIRERLKAELRLDRERSGRLTDMAR